jgi:hypothetical protein
MKLEGDASVLEEALSIFKDIPKAKAAIQDLVNINAMKTLLPLLDARTMHLNHCNDRLVPKP